MIPGMRTRHASTAAALAAGASLAGAAALAGPPPPAGPSFALLGSYATGLGGESSGATRSRTA